MSAITNPVTTEEVSKLLVGDFGNSRYSAVANELYRDAQRVLGLTEVQADKLAKAWMADFGRIMARSTVSGYSIGKPNKDKIATLKEAVSSVKDRLTPALSLAATVQKLDNVRADYGVVASYKVEFTENFADWLSVE